MGFNSPVQHTRSPQDQGQGREIQKRKDRKKRDGQRGSKTERGTGWRKIHTSRRRTTRTSIKKERFRNGNREKQTESKTEKGGGREGEGGQMTHQEEEEEEGHQD